jgi:hypothetical protein
MVTQGVTTQAIGEEGGFDYWEVTTDAVGEEGGGFNSTMAIGEEGGSDDGVAPYATYASHEAGGFDEREIASTYARGEEGGHLEPILRPIEDGGMTTLAMGEEGGEWALFNEVGDFMNSSNNSGDVPFL